MTNNQTSWEVEFDKEFKCINSNCDSKGNIPVKDADGDWVAEQCQYCFERLFKYKDFIRKVVAQAKAEERQRIVDKINNLKVMDDNGVWSFVREQLLKSIERESPPTATRLSKKT
jgi:hypothetical protein